MEIAVHEEVDAFPLDGAYAFMQVLRAKYGWADAMPTPGFFGPNPPVTVNLEVGVNKSVQVIWGGFAIPGIQGQLQTSATEKDGGKRVFCISGKIKKKHQAEIAEIAQATRDYVKTQSVYKGQAILLKTDEDGDFDYDIPPSFLDLSKVNESELIFAKDTQDQIETSLFVPIEKTELCRKFQIPLKRTVLLEGKFGTGKTLTAYVTAKKAERHGWTFIYLDRVTALKDAVAFARQYAPSVIFAEDLDRVVSGGRTVEVDDILNNVDGIESKNCEVIGIFTTNDVKAIDKAMMRPGRLDAVITVNPPDAAAAERLMRQYSRGLIGTREDLTKAGLEVAGQIPAVIREVVERAKLFALKRFEGSENKITLTGDHLVLAAKSMKLHLKLMQPTDDEEVKTPEYKLGVALSNIVNKSTLESFNGSKEKIADLHQKLVEENQ
jgi:transitional endoplasmic reticulum ATPase